MQIHAALTRIHNTEVAVVWVSRYALKTAHTAEVFIRELERELFRRPVVLAAPGKGSQPPLLYGCDDHIISHLAETPIMSLPWATFDL